MLTPRENAIRYFKNEEYEWMPSSFDQVRFLPEMIIDNIARGMVAQQKPFPMEKYGGPDSFGVKWVFEPAVNGSIDLEPLFSDPDDLENWEELLPFPDLSKLDWEGCAKENAEFLKPDKIVFTTIFTGFFERLISLVGFENAAMALVDEDQEDTVRALFDRLADFYIELGQYLHRYFNVEWIEVHDDWGTQKTTMFSVDTHEEMIAPYIKKVVDGFHKEGIFFEMHSCGKIEDLIPNLIDTGCDTWKGQQNNDKLMLVNKYGNQFHFAVEVRPAGPLSDEETMAFVEKFIETYQGKNVWFSMGRSFTPKQIEMISARLREIK